MANPTLHGAGPSRHNQQASSPNPDRRPSASRKGHEKAAPTLRVDASNGGRLQEAAGTTTTNTNGLQVAAEAMITSDRLQEAAGATSTPAITKLAAAASSTRRRLQTRPATQAVSYTHLKLP